MAEEQANPSGAVPPPADLKAEAVSLRLAGYSRSQIASTLGIRSHRRLSGLLRGVPPLAWTRRPNARDEIRERAVELRLAGLSYREISEMLGGVATSTLSNWLRHLPLNEEHKAAMTVRARGVSATRADSNRARRVARDARVVAEAKAEIGELAESELFVAGVVAYWAEGCKNKPWRSGERVSFVNSDAAMVRLFLAWLQLIEVDSDQLVFRILIHDSADVARARSHWAEVASASASDFSVTLKRHSVSTIRHNVGENYHGCLVVSVRRSAMLNLRIAGWFEGLVARFMGVDVASSFEG